MFLVNVHFVAGCVLFGVFIGWLLGVLACRTK